MKRRNTTLAVLAVFTIIICSIYFGFNFWLESQLSPLDKQSTNFIMIDIPSGTSTNQIASILEERGIIKSATAFKLQTKLEGNDSKYRAGVYSFNASMSVEKIMALLIEGRSQTTKITIPEGLDIKRVVEKLSSEGHIDAEEFMYEIEHGVFNYDFVSELPEGPNRLEGYLYPETYFVSEGASAHEIINILLGQFNKIYIDEYKKRAAELNMTMHEIITMASILEREAVINSEMPTIASVFYNRMKIDMPLQTDATIQYALGEQKKRLTYADLKVDSPYNTYINKGLPPGPIASPGNAAINAALYPAETDYIFFVATGDGSHAFSVDYSQFLKDKEAYISKVFGK